jgi:YVTN family beta-propeller protein
MRVNHRNGWLLAGVLLAAAAPQVARAAGPYAIVSGRWDNTVVVIDLAKAIDPANDGTANAVINRLRVIPDIDPRNTGTADTPASGQPVNVVIPPAGPFAYVVNHSGRATPAATEAFQHGHDGTVTVLDLRKALDPANNGTLNAVVATIPTGGYGAVGLAVTPDRRFAFVSSAEGVGNEDGGRTISVIDLMARATVGKVIQAFGKPGFPCPPVPIPHSAPNVSFGCFADTNGVALSPRRGGYLFTANGGSDDVSVIDVTRALAGDAGAEVARIPVGVGPWGIAVSPDGGLVAVANRESARTGAEGNTISIIDVEKAIAGAKDAEISRLLLGTNNPAMATRPYAPAFTPDGRQLVVTHFGTNNVSIVDVAKAVAGDPAEIARIPLATPGGGPSRPRGVAITGDGRYAVVTGAARGAPSSGVLWVIDVPARKVVGRVTGVGNEAYLLDILSGPR